MSVKPIKTCLALAVAVIALGAPIDNAEAKRRIGGSWGSSSQKAPKAADDRKGTSLPIVVPGVALGSSTRKPIEIAKVVDLPDVAEFAREDGSYVDLGWRFVGETGGEWVGYIGSDADYLTISPDQLTAIMQIAGIASLPEPPTRIGQRAQANDGATMSSAGGSVLSTLLPFAALFYIAVAARRRFFPKSAAGTAHPSGDPTADWMSKAENVMAAAAPRRPAGESAVMRASTVVRGSPSAFGRRA